MATTDETATTDAQPSNDDADTFEEPITLDARGPATLERPFGDDDCHGVIETETTVEITIPYETVEAVHDAFFKDSLNHKTLKRPYNRVFKPNARDFIEAELSPMGCRIDDYDEWDVELDGSVTAWVQVFEACGDPKAEAESWYRQNRSIGDGIKLAAQEFERRNDG